MGSDMTKASATPAHDRGRPDGPRAACDAAYQGAPGAYSEDAAFRLTGPDADLLPCESLEQVFQAVGNGRARTAVVPVENTLAGTVPHAYELMLASELEARAETLVRIDHVLAAPPGVALERVRRVLSHPVALAQCARFFRTHPHMTPVPVFDTAGAVPLALQDGRGETAAVASRRAAELHGAAVLATGIQDHAENFTRFLLLSRSGSPRPSRAGALNKAILTFRIAHRPGALAHALQGFAEKDLNLTKIESRPIHGQPFEYVFVVEVVSTRSADALLQTIREVEPRTRSLRVLGAFAVEPRGEASPDAGGASSTATPPGSLA